MKFILIGFFLTWSIIINGQTLKRSDFINTEWYSNNNDSNFYKKDTIFLIKYSNVWSEGKGYKSYYESFSRADSIIVRFEFNRKGKINFWELNYERASISIVNERTWEIDTKKNELIIRRNKQVEFILIPLSFKLIEFIVDSQGFKTVGITMIKKK